MKRFTIPIISLLFCFYTNAQDPFRNNGNLQIHPGGSLSLPGSFTNASTGALINNGNLYLQGTITNDQASMATGTGTVYLNGSSAQTLNGAHPYKTFALVSNNSAGILLNNSLHVSGAHTFTAGLITTSVTPHYLVYEAGSSQTGSTDARHVNGWVKKIGTTNFIFPVGNATYLRSMAINSLSGSSEFDVKYFSNAPNPSLLLAPMDDMHTAEYWSVTKVSGGTASVVMNWDNSKVGFPNWPVAEIVAASWNGSVWAQAGGTASGNVTTSGSITSSSVSSLSLFTFGSKSFPLPLTLIKFTATRRDNNTRIEWTTVSEQNVSHFMVERSDDGIHFYSIGRLPARNTGNLEKYSLDDGRIINGTAWYRLRSIDLDGKETMSKIVTITVKSDDQGLVLLTNPVRNKIILRADNKLNGLFDYQLDLVQGQTVLQGKLNIHNGGTYELPLSVQLAPGIYMLRVTNGRQLFLYKLVQL